MNTKRPRNFDSQKPLTPYNNIDNFLKLVNPDANVHFDQNEKIKVEAKQNITIPKVIQLDEKLVYGHINEKELQEKKIRHDMGYTRVTKSLTKGISMPNREGYECTDHDKQFFDSYIARQENKKLKIDIFEKLIILLENLTGQSDKLVNFADAEVEIKKTPQLNNNFTSQQLQELFTYWKSRREFYKRPLQRKFMVARPGVDDNNPHAAYRPQANTTEKMKTRKQNDQDNIQKKFQTLEEEFKLQKLLIDHIQAREHNKFRSNIEKNEQFIESLYQIDNQAQFNLQGIFSCNSHTEYFQKKQKYAQFTEDSIKNTPSVKTLNKLTKEYFSQNVAPGSSAHSDMLSDILNPKPLNKNNNITLTNKTPKPHKPSTNQDFSNIQSELQSENESTTKPTYSKKSHQHQQQLNHSQQQSSKNSIQIPTNILLNDSKKDQNPIKPQGKGKNDKLEKFQKLKEQALKKKNKEELRKLQEIQKQKEQAEQALINSQQQNLIPTANDTHIQHRKKDNNINNNSDNSRPPHINMAQQELQQKKIQEEQQNERKYIIAMILASFYSEGLKNEIKFEDLKPNKLNDLNKKLQSLKPVQKQIHNEGRDRKQTQIKKQQEQDYKIWLNKKLTKFNALQEEKIKQQQNNDQQQQQKAIKFKVYKTFGRNGQQQLIRAFGELTNTYSYYNSQKAYKNIDDYTQGQMKDEEFNKNREILESQHYYRKMNKYLPYLRYDHYDEDHNILNEEENDYSRIKQVKDDDELFDTVKNNIKKMKDAIEDKKRQEIEQEQQKQRQIQMQIEEEQRQKQEEINRIQNQNKIQQQQQIQPTNEFSNLDNIGGTDFNKMDGMDNLNEFDAQFDQFDPSKIEFE